MENLGQIAVARTCFHLRKWRTHVATGCDVIASDSIVETWSSPFSDIVDKHLPVKKHRVKRKQQPKWLTVDIIDAIKTRDRFKSNNNHEEYRVWRNKVNKIIKFSKNSNIQK